MVFLGATPADAAAKTITGKDGAPLVLVPAGEFIMGSDEGPDEKPQRRVYLDGFYIDKYPITNVRFRASGMSPKRDYGPKFNGTSQPVVGVTWHQAREYCQKEGRRLPTEAEWENAARGTDGRKYPWGNSWDASKLIWDENGKGRTHPVDRSYNTNKSPYGAVDMTGNVWEWIQDWFRENYYRNAPARNPKGPGSGDGRLLRGGSWRNSYTWYFRPAYRFGYAPVENSDIWGFRCAKDLQ